MSQENHIVPFKTHALVLAGLITMTLLSVAATQIHLGTLTVMIALLLATTKASLVLTFFMHLKFDSRFFAFMVTGVMFLIGIVIFITLLDYIYR